MKKHSIVIAALILLMVALPRQQAHAQLIDAVESAIEKAIMTADVAIQKAQNQTILLQNAEAQLENNLHLSSLTDISSWLNKEKSLYADYYKELQTVKTAISDYDEVKRIIAQQTELMTEYKNAYNLFKQDRNFSPDEINSMSNVYSGILNESARDLQELSTAITSFQSQMSDAERFGLIHRSGEHMQQNLNNLRQYNNANMQLTLQRAQDKNDMNQVRTLYGLPQN